MRGINKETLTALFKSRLLRTTSKIALIGFLLNGAYQHYTPESIKEPVAAKVKSLLPSWAKSSAVDSGELTPIFQSKENFNILGGSSKSSFFNFESDIADKWYATLGRHSALLKNEENVTILKKWFAQLDDMKGLSVAEKTKAVDALIDRQIKYVNDHKIFKMNDKNFDYWQSPLETIFFKVGDCEDFAILKYYALRYLNVPAERVFVVTVSEKNETTLNHATLMVNTYEPGFLKRQWESLTAWIMKSPPKTEFVIADNDKSELGLLVQERDARYRPYHALNEQGLWKIRDGGNMSWKAPAPKPGTP